MGRFSDATDGLGGVGTQRRRADPGQQRGAWGRLQLAEGDACLLVGQFGVGDDRVNVDVDRVNRHGGEGLDPFSDNFAGELRDGNGRCGPSGGDLHVEVDDDALSAYVGDQVHGDAREATSGELTEPGGVVDHPGDLSGCPEGDLLDDPRTDGGAAVGIHCGAHPLPR